MKKIVPFLLLFCFSLVGCNNVEPNSEVESEKQVNPSENDESNKETILSMIESFGSKLQKVSLMAPASEVAKSMNAEYGGIVAPELIGKWVKDPLNAPGRLTSSPWPDRIDVTDIQRVSDSSYSIIGEIVEVTSTQEVADKVPVELTVEKVDDQWKITDVKMKREVNDESVVYEDFQYGFRFNLPASWKGYSIIHEEWEGFAAEGGVIEKGPMISIRHPEWTAEQPRQDIPIMIFNIDQWDALQAQKFHIGAAPFGPKELARNDDFVFALPARYNFAFLTGYEEVEEILEHDPIEVQ